MTALLLLFVGLGVVAGYHSTRVHSPRCLLDGWLHLNCYFPFHTTLSLPLPATITTHFNAPFAIPQPSGLTSSNAKIVASNSFECNPNEAAFCQLGRA